jgi:hypothetical protein
VHGSSRLRSSLPHLFDAGTVYTVLRAMTVHGVQLKAGDTLPTDSPLRQDPTRLEVLCRTRQLVVTQALGAKVGNEDLQATYQMLKNGPPAEEGQQPVAAALDLSQLTGPQLVKACRDRGLPAWGNKDVLRQRLRKAMG